jgi:erythromycin esterase-like protein
MSGKTSSFRDSVTVLNGSPDDYETLLDSVGDAHFVMIGEASHGTHEFYLERARITELLIKNKKFNAVATEADWPDAYRVNRYVQGLGYDGNPERALRDFTRFPQWMWRNTDVVNFLKWLHNYNTTSEPDDRVGYYGIDLYSLYTSIESVLAYLDKTDPAAAARARERYNCFEHFNRDSQAYGMHATLGLTPDCENEVIQQLIDLRKSSAEYLHRDGLVAREDHFVAEQNALVVSNAERYYRSMFESGENSWNIRDRHMAQTIEALARHIKTTGREPRIVIWAHNSHLGDARATDRARYGELNLGQLVREAHDGDSLSVGFSTYSGSVTATSEWEEPAQHKRVRPGLPGSYEAYFHEIGIPNFLVRTNNEELSIPRLQRAIGVIYRPDTERQSHYYEATLSRQFDWMVHFDRTHAVEPLEKGKTWHPGPNADVPEAFPTGL